MEKHLKEISFCFPRLPRAALKLLRHDYGTWKVYLNLSFDLQYVGLFKNKHVAGSLNMKSAPFRILIEFCYMLTTCILRSNVNVDCVQLCKFVSCFTEK